MLIMKLIEKILKEKLVFYLLVIWGLSMAISGINNVAYTAYAISQEGSEFETFLLLSNVNSLLNTIVGTILIILGLKMRTWSLNRN